jgi:hypothetical protein
MRSCERREVFDSTATHHHQSLFTVAEARQHHHTPSSNKTNASSDFN